MDEKREITKGEFVFLGASLLSFRCFMSLNDMEKLYLVRNELHFTNNHEPPQPYIENINTAEIDREREKISHICLRVLLNKSV